MGKLTSSKDAIDVITDTMFSFSFLDYFVRRSYVQKEPTAVAITKDWMSQAGQSKAIFSPGMIYGYLYVGILWGKERWSDLLPDEPWINLKNDWHLTNSSFQDTKEANPTLRHVVRRLRNAIGHSSIDIKMLPGMSPANIDTTVEILFQDTDPRDATNVFNGKMLLSDVYKFIKKYHSEIHAYESNQR